MQVVAILSTRAPLIESVKAAQRVYKAGHEALDLSLEFRMAHLFCPRPPEKWEESMIKLTERADSVILLDPVEQHNRLVSRCIEENIPVFLSFEDWVATLIP